MELRPRSWSSGVLVALVVAVVVCGSLNAMPGRADASTQAKFRSSIWLPYWRMSAAKAEVARNSGVLRTASMFWYDARSCSSVGGYPGAGNKATIATLRSRGVKIVATVTATGLTPRVAASCFASPARRAAHIDRLVRIVKSRNYVGLDLDYEHLALTKNKRLARTVRTGYSTFVTELCTRLRSIGKSCIITVMPRWSDAYSVWRGKLIPAVYDYEAIGAAVTTLRVMAYDQHAGRYGPGPIAGYGWVKKIIRYTAGKVPLRKVELGIPTYGRDFSRRRSVALFGRDAVALARRHHAKPRYNRTQREWTFTYRVRGVKHTVWFSNPKAVADRTRLARSSGMAGAAYWAASLAQPGTWKAVRKVR